LDVGCAVQKRRCASILVSTALRFAKTFPNSTLREIRFTNFDSLTAEIFREEFYRRFPELITEESNKTNNKKDNVPQ
jgi:hypothetical protein